MFYIIDYGVSLNNYCILPNYIMGSGVWVSFEISNGFHFWQKLFDDPQRMWESWFHATNACIIERFKLKWVTLHCIKSNICDFSWCWKKWVRPKHTPAVTISAGCCHVTIVLPICHYPGDERTRTGYSRHLNRLL